MGDGKGTIVAHQRLVQAGRPAAEAIVTWVFPEPNRAWLGLQRKPDPLAVAGLQVNAARVLAELDYAPAVPTLERARATLKDPELIKGMDAALAKLRRTQLLCPRCRGGELTSDVGACRVGGPTCRKKTSSGMLSSCSPCARRTGRCERCREPVAFALPHEDVLRGAINGLVPGDGRAGGIAAGSLTAWGAPACREVLRRLFPKPDVVWLRMDGDVPGLWFQGMQTNAARVFAAVGYLEALPALRAARAKVSEPQNRAALEAAIEALAELEKRRGPVPLVPR